MERNIALAKVKHERSNQKYDKISKTLVNSKAGIQHLCDKLVDETLHGRGLAAVAVKDDNMVKSLQ